MSYIFFLCFQVKINIIYAAYVRVVLIMLVGHRHSLQQVICTI